MLPSTPLAPDPVSVAMRHRMFQPAEHSAHTRHSSFLFRFRLFRFFSFQIGSSLTFRHNFFPFYFISEVNLQNTIWGGFRIPHRKSEKFKVF